MSSIRYLVVSVVGTILRFFPWPAKTGLMEIGHPDRNSPVLVTCNYSLTLERVRRALKGVDAYLLVANSRGINVWCAATGGLLTNHDVVSVLKTSGIEQRVDHRTVILPQLSATGVEARVVKRRTNWKTVWGPVYAQDIPLFLTSGLVKTRRMREVEFPWVQRVEMAAAMAFPISLVLALVLSVLWREAVVPAAVYVWVLSLVIYVGFPLYRRWLGAGARTGGRVFVVLGSLWVIPMLVLTAHAVAFGQEGWGFVLRWGVVSLVALLFLGIDILGVTPVFKSGLQEDRRLEVVLDEERCRGAAYCVDTCPRGCYEVKDDLHKASMPGAERCVQCGACIVQCPFDALQFRSPKGEVIAPDTIRKFKLNLMGKRVER